MIARRVADDAHAPAYFVRERRAMLTHVCSRAMRVIYGPSESIAHSTLTEPAIGAGICRSRLSLVTYVCGWHVIERYIYVYAQTVF